ncbi:DUF4362 domain-containing protein [Cohnella soli]|uniref:DUF4362 domain-containing protein n=1 Tax=Cohnella soli TaxID=425005 RepID=A0ABW0HSI9_9BACL
MGKWKAVVIAIGLAVMLVGCGARESEQGAVGASSLAGEVSEAAQTSWSGFSPTSATVSRSQRFGSVYSAALGKLSEAKELKSIVGAMKNAKQIPGMLDVANPEYDVVLTDKNGGKRELHLWLGTLKGKDGMYMFVSDTGTGYKIDSEDADDLRELIGKIEYSSEQAIANGEIVQSIRGLANTDRWLDFVKSVGEGKSAEVHIVTYSIEGDPIFQDLLFENGTIVYTTDTTMDKFGVPERTRSFCKGIDNAKSEQGTKYTLNQCDEPVHFEFDIPMEND